MGGKNDDNERSATMPIRDLKDNHTLENKKINGWSTTDIGPTGI